MSHRNGNVLPVSVYMLEKEMQKMKFDFKSWSLICFCLAAENSDGEEYCLV